MKKFRDSALLNGMLIGIGLGFFAGGWVGRHFYYLLADVARITSPGDVELMKASGDKALLLCIIIGVILLAMGIGREIYQRAKYGSKLSS